MNLDSYLNTIEPAAKLAKRMKGSEKANCVLLCRARKSKLLMPIKSCVEIEQLTSRQVTRQSLRDDWQEIWPELTNAPQE